MSAMGICSDFQPYTNMHFIKHDLHLFQGGKENLIYAKHLPSATFTFYFRKTVADGKITDLQQQLPSLLFSLHGKCVRSW